MIEEIVPQFLVLVEGPDNASRGVANNIDLTKLGQIGIGGADNLDQIPSVIHAGIQRHLLGTLDHGTLQ